MGNILSATNDSSFAAVWNGPAYVAERRRLAEIRPTGDFAPCGECTRHCQHNVALNKVYDIVEGDDAVIEQLEKPQQRCGLVLSVTRREGPRPHARATCQAIDCKTTKVRPAIARRGGETPAKGTDTHTHTHTHTHTR